MDRRCGADTVGMARIGIGLAVVVALGWFLFGRGDNASAVTDCLKDAGATVDESEEFARVFPYAIAVRSLDRVQSYPELDGARFYSVAYGNDRALLFVGQGDDDAAAFEQTLGGLVGGEGGTMSSLRTGKALLVWERPTYAPDIDGCFS
ncbi:MAG TPA: hypothetical protein VFR32_12150 [Gaiellaceae bacterium]|nr:hypothetical protein [Gaiellaceae bacterium]